MLILLKLYVNLTKTFDIISILY